MPAEIRHEGGETLRTSFSRDLAKLVMIQPTKPTYQTYAVQDTSLIHGRLLQRQQRGQKPGERGLTLVTHKIFSRLKLVLSGDCLSNTFPTLVLSSLFHSFLNTNTEENTADLHI